MTRKKRETACRNTGMPYPAFSANPLTLAGAVQFFVTSHDWHEKLPATTQDCLILPFGQNGLFLIELDIFLQLPATWQTWETACRNTGMPYPTFSTNPLALAGVVQFLVNFPRLTRESACDDKRLSHLHLRARRLVLDWTYSSFLQLPTTLKTWETASRNTGTPRYTFRANPRPIGGVALFFVTSLEKLPATTLECHILHYGQNCLIFIEFDQLLPLSTTRQTFETACRNTGMPYPAFSANPLALAGVVQSFVTSHDSHEELPATTQDCLISLYGQNGL